MGCPIDTGSCLCSPSSKNLAVLGTNQEEIPVNVSEGENEGSGESAGHWLYSALQHVTPDLQLKPTS